MDRILEGKVALVTGAGTGLGRGILRQAREAEQEPGTPASYLAGAFGARGHNATCLTACAASAW